MVLNNIISLYNLICLFTLKVKVVFKAYLNKISKLRKFLINAIKYTQYLYFFLYFKQKIIRKIKLKEYNFT